MRKILIPLIAIILLNSSCRKKLVDLENPTAYNYNTYFDSPDRINEAVIATYAVFLHPGMYSRDYYYIFDLLGNEDTIINKPGQDLSEFEKYKHTKTTENLDYLWASLYQIILRSNVVLDRSNVLLNGNYNNDASIKRYVAEAKVLRAYAYFQLVTLWGRVPLRKSYEETIANPRPPRTDTNTIWKFIEQDLIDATGEASLEDHYDGDDLGRITKGAAIALLGKVYLYRKNWQQAKIQFENIVNNPGRFGYDLPSTLYDDDEGLFGQHNQENPEIIFQVMHKKYNNFATDGQYFNYVEGKQETSEGYATYSARAYEYGFADDQKVQVSTALKKAFTYSVNGATITDPRAGYFMYSADASSGAKDSFCERCDSVRHTFPDGTWWKKYEYYEDVPVLRRAASGINSVVIRYADVLLMLSESYIEQNNNLSTARDLINDVRNRAGADPINSPFANQIEARTALRRERQIELCGEQIRFFDLVRWGILASTLNAEYKSAVVEPNKHTLLPIPQQERNTNPNVANDISPNGWN